MKKDKCFQLFAVIFLTAAASVAQSKCSSKQAFDGDDDPCLDKAPSPPQAVLASILSTDAARETLEDIDPAKRAAIPELLKSLVVHLRSEQQRDMIVRGDFPMSGGDNTWFWIITAAETRPTATWVQGNRVTILRSRHNGYKDIRTDWYAGSHRAVQIFRYDGHRYKLFHEKYEDSPAT